MTSIRSFRALAATFSHHRNLTAVTVFCSRNLSLSSAKYPAMSSSKFQLAEKYHGSEKNVWVEFAGLANQYKALNLGQGFPDFTPPDHLIQSFHQVLNEGVASHHQYARSYGLPNFVQTLAKLYGPLMGRELNPMTEILVSVGAYGSLFSSIQSLLNKDDEVIIIEPFFDCYIHMVRNAGGKPVFVPLRETSDKQVTSSSDWKLDPNEFAAAFSSKTKAVILNTPHNPVGKVFNKEELTMIADLCKKHDVVCISDEVYEWLVYDEEKHVKIATLPDMFERTITIGSGGKTFSATGWKLGWAIGPENLVKNMGVVHQNCAYTVPTLIQETVARGLQKEMGRLGQPDCYFTALAEETAPKRDALAKCLADLGMKVTVPQGGYFLMADYSVLGLKYDDDGTDDPADFKFARWLTKAKNLAVIPPTAFYSPEHVNLGDKYIRFCFIKKPETIQAAEKLLKEWKDSL